MALKYKVTNYALIATALILINAVVFFVYGNIQSTVEVAATISDGKFIQVFTNSSDSPSTLNIVKGQEYVYRFERQTPFPIKIRIDPTDDINGRFIIKYVRIQNPYIEFFCQDFNCGFESHNISTGLNGYIATSSDPILVIKNIGGKKSAYIRHVARVVFLFLLFNLTVLLICGIKKPRIIIFLVFINILILFLATRHVNLVTYLQSSADVVGMANYSGQSFYNNILIFYGIVLILNIISLRVFKIVDSHNSATKYD